ncbi:MULTISPECIES: flagellar biosynthetic protein FliO [unclassified Sedimentibacter]|uniref:flagellar biosynthetic protein FliO n=1 Tax=unclassified Sedimentibacter TaxID=2649220 RepID=UPI0035A6DF84
MFLTYYSTKWLSAKTSIGMKSKYINIVDKIMLGQNKFLAIAEINGKFYLIGITEKNINVLRELDDFYPATDEITEHPAEFGKLIDKFLKK